MLFPFYDIILVEGFNNSGSYRQHNTGTCAAADLTAAFSCPKMESERRERHGHIKDSNVAAENSPAGISELPAGNPKYPGQDVRFLHRAADSGSGWVLDSSLHTGKPGQSDPAFHLPGSMHGDPAPAPDRTLPAPGVG